MAGLRLGLAWGCEDNSGVVFVVTVAPGAEPAGVDMGFACSCGFELEDDLEFEAVEGLRVEWIELDLLEVDARDGVLLVCRLLTPEDEKEKSLFISHHSLPSHCKNSRLSCNLHFISFSTLTSLEILALLNPFCNSL